MTIKQLFAKVRMDANINDLAAVRFSDYQMIMALNAVLSLIYQTVGTMSSTILNKNVTIKMKNGKGQLPDDFLQAVLVCDGSGSPLRACTKTEGIGSGSYRISGNVIRSDNTEIDLEYKPFFEELEYSDIEDDLPTPNLFNEYLRKYMVTILLSGTPQGDAEMIAKLTGDVKAIVANRDFASLDVASTVSWKV